jgi:DNA-binding MarR family transcriptional regulator
MMSREQKHGKSNSTAARRDLSLSERGILGRGVRIRLDSDWSIMVVSYNQMGKKLATYSLHESLGYLTYQASGAIRKHIGRELARRGFPIKAEHFAGLVYIWDEDGEPQRVLAEKLYRDKTTVTRLVTELESLGLIKRVPGQEDAREKRIFLTERGKKLMTKVTQLVQEILLLAQKGIGTREIRICKDVLRRVRQNLG